MKQADATAVERLGVERWGVWLFHCTVPVCLRHSQGWVEDWGLKRRGELFQVAEWCLPASHVFVSCHALHRFKNKEPSPDHRD
jgi:hypothetical protein